MTKTKWFGRLLGAFRYGLLAVAIIYLALNVPWYDYVTLADGETRVRLLEDRSETSGEVVVLRDGAAVVLSVDEVHRLMDGTVIDKQLGIASVVRSLDGSRALLALLIFLPVPLLQSLRLVWMLAIQEVPLTYFTSVKLSFVGNFFNFALPGTTGGDLIKAYYLTQYTHRKTEAVTTIFLDRMVGLLGLLVLAGSMILVQWNNPQVGQWSLMLATIVVLLGIGATVVLSSRVRRGLRLRELAEQLPAGPHLVRVGRAMVAMGRHKVYVAGCLGLTLSLQLCVFISAIVMARALGMDGGFFHYLMFLPIGFMLASLPIAPPQGFGVMEWAFVEFFTGSGFMNHASQALALALALRITQLVWALPGALVPLLGAHVPRSDELERFESDEAAPPGPAPAVVAPPTAHPTISIETERTRDRS